MLRNADVIRVGLIGYGFAGRTFHAPLFGGQPQLVLGGAHSALAISHDGRFVAVVDKDKSLTKESLLILDLSIGKSRLIQARSGFEYFDNVLAWSPDNRYIATAIGVGNPVGFAVIDRETGVLHAVGARSYVGVMGLAWLPDSKHWLASVDRGNSLSQLVLVDYPSAIRLRLIKAPVEDAVCLFFSSTLASFLADSELSSTTRVVLIAEEFAPFETIGCVYATWDLSAPIKRASLDANVDPRKLTRDLTSSCIVPKSLAAYLLKQGPAQESLVFRTWGDYASVYLALTLVNEVWKEDKEIVVSLTGPRINRISLGQPHSEDTELVHLLNRAAEWVYADPREVEIRHTLFTNELAREWPGSSPLCSEFKVRGPRALDSAMTAYRAHLREGSKDTLKSLSDLRKTLSDEVAKVSAQTRELISLLWKDFAIAATALLTRIALIFADKHAAADSVEMRIVLLGTGAFLVVNLYITLRANERFMRIAEGSRSVWKQKLFGFLAEEDLKSLADRPIEQSVKAYQQARRVVVVIYALVVLLLIIASAPAFAEAVVAWVANGMHYVINRIITQQPWRS